MSAITNMNSATAMSGGNGSDLKHLKRSLVESSKCLDENKAALNVLIGALKQKNQSKEFEVVWVYKVIPRILDFLPSESLTHLTTDSRYKIIPEQLWRQIFEPAMLESLGLEFKRPSCFSTPEGVRTWVESLDELQDISIEENAGFTLLTLPEGLSLNKLIELAKTPQEGFIPAMITWMKSSSQGLHENTPIKGTIVAISNKLLLGSRDERVKEQSKLAAKHGCQLPRMIEVAALLFLTFIRSSATENGPVYLLNKTPRSYTRCIEEITTQKPEDSFQEKSETGTETHWVIGEFTQKGVIANVCSSEREAIGVLATKTLC